MNAATKSHQNIFNEVTLKAKHIEQNWNDIYSDICIKLDSSSSLAQLDKDFHLAFDQLNDELENPTLILATTGTTSSGKSTIINLLCGADIMPRMPQEMSAGVVYLKHSTNGIRHLKICNTEGATWHCGEWNNLTDEQIQTRLTEVMDTFNKLKGMGQPETPYIEITYPIACFNDSSLLSLETLPKNTQFKIMDLPGLRNQQDNTNKKVIENCRDALCIVAYNMEETDENRRRALVYEVMQQVKQMGGSPVRMLFALNRIDVFRKDPDWERREHEYIEKTQMEIKDILADGLPEYKDILSDLSYCPLSSLPALFAQQMMIPEYRVQAADKLDEHFSGLIPDELLDDLPRNPNKWETQDFNNVSKAVWETSYGKAFFSGLDQHIQKYFPALVLPSTVSRFNDEAEQSINEVIRLCNSEINSTTETYEIYKDTLIEQNAQLREFFESSAEGLKQPFTDILKKNTENTENTGSTGSTGNTEGIEEAIDTLFLSEPYKSQLDREKFRPIHQWKQILFKLQTSIIEGALQSINKNTRNFSGCTAVELLPEHLQIKLDNVFKYFNTKADSNTTRVDRSVEALNSVLSIALESQIKIENHRINEAFDLLLAFYLDYLKQEINRIAPEWGLTISSKSIRDIPKPDITSVILKAAPEKQSYEEGIWWTFGIMKRSCTVEIMPDIESLSNEWTEACRQQSEVYTRPFAEMIVSYLSELNEQINQAQEDTLKKYMKALDSARQKNTKTYKEAQDSWNPLLEKTKRCQKNVSNFYKDIGSY